MLRVSLLHSFEKCALIAKQCTAIFKSQSFGDLISWAHIAQTAN